MVLVRVIFFDIDDTLITHSDAIRTAANALHAEHGLEVDREQFLTTWQAAHRRYYPRYLRGELSYEQLRRLRVRGTINPELGDEDADRVFSDYLAVYRAAWTLFSDVVPCLAALASFPLGVISNGPSEEQRRKLSAMGIADRFQHVLISEECGYPKPSPEIYLEACRMAGVQPGDAVHVGDHPEIDVAGAQAVGLRAIWLDRSGPTPAHTRPNVVSSLLDLPKLVEKG